LLGELEEELSVLRLRSGDEDGDGALEGSSLGAVAREVEELEVSTLGVRLRGLRRRVWVWGAEKAKSERFRRPLKLGEGPSIASRLASRLASSALIGRGLVSAMVVGCSAFRIPRMKIEGVEDLRLESVASIIVGGG
jgi:hypothetical protein